MCLKLLVPMVATTPVALVMSKGGHMGGGLAVDQLLGPVVAACPYLVPILATQSQWYCRWTGRADRTRSVVFLILF